ncbi:hypothetical protein M2322_002223 [Rhodoblastus acidophilus]|nr:hypothetical protein [Rhodoblastus acidophilus]
MSQTSLPHAALALTNGPEALRVLGLLRQRLRYTLQKLWVLLYRVLECVRLRVFGMYHDDLSSLLDAANGGTHEIERESVRKVIVTLAGESTKLVLTTPFFTSLSSFRRESRLRRHA